MGNIKPVRKTLYRCTVCGAEYYERAKAEERCGSYELEPPRFKVGEQVLFWYAGTQKLAKITRRVGPVIGNRCREDGRRLMGTGAHVYQYMLKPIGENPDGPLCKGFTYWTSELKPTKKK